MDAKAKLPFAEQQELYVTRCMMLGAMFKYDDYGHPERASARKYWQCIVSGPLRDGMSYSRIGFGYDQADAAYDYLRRYHLELL